MVCALASIMFVDLRFTSIFDHLQYPVMIISKHNLYQVNHKIAYTPRYVIKRAKRLTPGLAGWRKTKHRIRIRSAMFFVSKFSHSNLLFSKYSLMRTYLTISDHPLLFSPNPLPLSHSLTMPANHSEPLNLITFFLSFCVQFCFF